MGRVTQRRKVHKYVLDGSPQALEFPVRHREDVLAVEEPLEIRMGSLSFSVTMRTPGDDFDLVAGFLVSEGVIWSPDQLVSLRFCAGEDEDGVQTFNVVEAQLRPDVVRSGHRTERLHVQLVRHLRHGLHRGRAQVLAFQPGGGPADSARRHASRRCRTGSAKPRRVFDVTGGVHAAGLFRIDDDGSAELLCLREDVGRHNAVDKVVGWALREGLLPLRGTVLQVSGRASFELVQKAALAGIPVLAAVSAPSSLAVELAEASGMTLAGFSRGTSA